MKQQQKEHFTRQSSSIAGQSFSVELSAKLFETVYGNMYRYKEAAVVRELLCNALDSHQMRDRFYKLIPSHVISVLMFPSASVSIYLAPKGKKPEIHLPDEFEPWLEIKDYGVGLSLEQIVGFPISAKEDEVLVQGNMVVKDTEIPDGATIIGEPGFYEGVMVFRDPENNEIIRGPGLYTTLFRSTKAEDNDQIGAFGLGSKSPFAVSDSFTVESRYEGKLYRFLMYLNDKRIPCCDIATKDLDSRDPTPEDTDEYNGMTVRVPIKNSEYARFAKELQRLGRVMESDQLPEVENTRYFSGFTTIERDSRVNNTYVQKEKSGSHYAVMGGVSYPIDVKQLPEHLSHILSRFPTTYTFFELGELNVPPSREDLSYDEFTRFALESAMTKLRDDVIKESIEDVIREYKKGPICAFYAKAKYKDLYGENFLTLLNENVPEEPRVTAKGKIRGVKYSPDVDREAVRLMKDYPTLIGSGDCIFSLTRFTSWQREEEYEMSLYDFDEHKNAPIFVIMDDNKSFVQKCKTLINKTNRDVITITPDPDLIKHRNSKLRKFYKNADQIRDLIRSWAGKKETIDYLQFADKFSEHYDGIINPDEILFMSELEYDRLVLDDNLGILKMQYSRGRRSGFEGKEMKGREIMDITDTGRRLVYIEMSSNTVVSHVNDSRLECDHIENMWNSLKKFQPYDSTRTDFGKAKHSIALSWLYQNNYHTELILVRRKAVPFLKKHKDYFVSFQDLLQEFYNHYQNMFVVADISKFAKAAKSILSMEGRTKYYQWISQSIKNDELYRKFETCQVGFKKAFVKSQICEKDRVKLLDGNENFYKAYEEEISNFSNIYRKYFSYQMLDDIYGILEFESMEETYHDTVNELSNTLNIEMNHLVLSGNYGKKAKKQENHRNKILVRKAIEKYLLVQYVAESYKPVMGSKWLGKDQFMKLLLNEIAGKD